jgi:hypothetical protein
MWSFLRSVLLVSALACLDAHHCCIAKPPQGQTVRLFERTFRLDDPSQVRELANFARECHETFRRCEADLKARRSRLLMEKSPGEMTLLEVKDFHATPTNGISSKQARGLEILSQLATNVNDRKDRQALLEVADAITNEGRSPMPPRIELAFAPFILLDFLYRPVGIGRKPATNLERYGVADLSTVDPKPGTFWRRPANISKQDLYAGFGRAQRPRWESNMWSYTAPKTSFGSLPGFEATADGIRIKIKFGETISEPFNARIFAALGYHADATDHASHLNVRYDRRLFREFDLRKDASTRLYRFGIPVMRIRLQHRYDPFDFIAGAVMKNGTRISGAQLRQSLFRDLGQPHPEEDPENFRKDFEADIDYLVTAPANIQRDDAPAKSIGSWDFGHLDHAGRRELRGACLLAAWLGWCDARFDNTRLKVVNADGNMELRHYFGDLGGGLGGATGFVKRKCESPRNMTWRITRPSEVCGRLEIFRPFRIINYTPLDDNPAFKAMTVDDARWMARLIAQITDDQIAQALAACDLDDSTAMAYQRKLKSRRDQMLSDLKPGDDEQPFAF